MKNHASLVRIKKTNALLRSLNDTPEVCELGVSMRFDSSCMQFGSSIHSVRWSIRCRVGKKNMTVSNGYNNTSTGLNNQLT